MRKENVANSKISRYVWTGPLDNAGNSRQGIWRRAVPPHCKTNAKYVKSKEKLPRMISCLFPYWEEGNHDGHKKGYTVVHLADRSFHDVRLYVPFLGHQRPTWNAQGLFSVLSPSTNPVLLDLPRAKVGIIKTRNHNHGNAARLRQRYAHLWVQRVIKNNLLATLSIHIQDKRLRELMNDHQGEHPLIFYKILSTTF